MKHHELNAVVLIAVLIATAAAPEQAGAAVIAFGNFWPNLLHAGDGVVSSELQLGVGLSSTGSITVTDGDTLTTRRRAPSLDTLSPPRGM